MRADPKIDALRDARYGANTEKAYRISLSAELALLTAPRVPPRCATRTAAKIPPRTRTDTWAGPRAVAERAPHVDFTLNGWMLKDGKPAHTPEWNRPDAPLESWDRDIAAAARKKWPEAERGNGNFFIRRVVEGAPSYIKAIKYQMRELVDVIRRFYRLPQEEKLRAAHEL